MFKKQLLIIWFPTLIVSVIGFFVFDNYRYHEPIISGLPRQFSSEPSLTPESVKAIFVGDIMLSRNVGKQMEKNQDFTFPFLKINSFLNSADFVFGNLEGPISDQGRNQGSIYSFRADPNVVKGLEGANFKVLSLANNHIWDWGQPALLQTIELLNQNNILPVGAGKDYDSVNQILVFREKGMRFGFFAMTDLYPESLQAASSSPGISNPDFELLEQKIKNAKEQSLIDFMIVSLHWGNEYEKEPRPWQVEQAHKLALAGADLIIGHHPHVIQTYEKYPSTAPGTGRQSLIFYSLGNFVFDQGFSEETMEGLAVEIEFPAPKRRSPSPRLPGVSGGEKSKPITSRLYQVKLNEFYQPELGEIIDPSITLRAR